MTNRSFSDNVVDALANGLRAIEAFGAGGRSLTLSEVAAGARLSRAAARRYLHTLCALGYAEHDGKRFRLTPRVLKLGYVFIATGPLPQLAQPILDALGRQTGMPVFLGVLDGTDVVFLARATPSPYPLQVGVGGRLSALTSASGRVLLAALGDADVEQTIRRAGQPRRVTVHTKTKAADLLREIHAARLAGYATSEKEIDLGTRSVSVPVVTPSGSVAAAMTLMASTTSPGSAQALQRALPVLRRASRQLGDLL